MQKTGILLHNSVSIKPAMTDKKWRQTTQSTDTTRLHTNLCFLKRRVDARSTGTTWRKTG